MTSQEQIDSAAFSPAPFAEILRPLFLVRDFRIDLHYAVVKTL